MSQSQKVLIVEDDIEFSKLLESIIKKSINHLEIQILNDEANAVSWIKNNPDSIIILDYRLKEKNADEIIKKINKLKIKSNIVVITGYNDIKIAIDIMKLGIKELLIKDENLLSLLPNIIKKEIENIEKEKKIKEAEKIKEEYESIYKTFVENFKGIAYRLTNNLKPIFIEGEVEKITGFKKEELFEFVNGIHSIIHPDDSEKIQKEIERLKNKETLYLILEYRIVTKNKEIKWLHELIYAVTDKAGNFQYIQGAIYDITEKKVIEEEFYKEKERLSAIIKNMNEGLIVTDMEGKIILINDAALQITEWEEKECLNESISKIYRIIPPDSSKIAQKNEYFKINGEEEKILLTKNNEEKIITDKISVFFDKNNKVNGVVIVFRDITEKKILDLEFQKANKFDALVTFAAGIAHDFNNLFTIINSNLSLALLQIPHDNEIYSLLVEMEHALNHAKELSKRLLSYSRGKELEKKEINILDIISNSAKFILKNSNITLELDLPSVIPPIVGDESEIYQVFNNLILNAKEAMSNNGKLKITGELIEVNTNMNLPLPNGHYFKIEISDTGVGIDKNYIDKIFDPYFTTKKHGTGLGLAICYSIIKRHNGYITLHSELNKGTTFFVYLPLNF